MNKTIYLTPRPIYLIPRPIYLTPRPNINSLSLNLSKYRPIKSGINISPESNPISNSITDIFNYSGGTLGAIGYDLNNERIIVSNNHVIAHQEYGTGWLGQNIYQPYLDCSSNNKIGNLKAYVPINKTSNNLVDAAYATIDSSIQIEEDNICGFPIGNSAEPTLNDDVYICGAFSGYSEGKITSLNVTAGNYNTDGTITWYIDQIETNIIGDHGDSGALLQRKSDNATLGLVMGKTSSSGTIIANKSTNVENLLGIKFGSPQTITNKKYICTEGGCLPDTNGIYNTSQECELNCKTNNIPKRTYNKCDVTKITVLSIFTLSSYYLYKKYRKK